MSREKSRIELIGEKNLVPKPKPVVPKGVKRIAEDEANGHESKKTAIEIGDDDAIILE
jgi:hypothetical protein